LNIGLIVNGDHDYKVYKEFFGNYLRLKQQFDESVHKHDITKPIEFKDISALNSPMQVKKVRISIIRNLQNYAFVTSKYNQNILVEEIIIKSLKVC